MERIAFVLMLALAASCGSCDDDTSGENNDSNATNNATNSTNNSTSNMTGGTTGAFIGWTITVEGGDVDLPALEGDMMTQDGRVSYVAIEGTADGGTISMELAGGELLAREFEDPRLFEVTWADPNYRCRGEDGFLVTVTTLEPNGQGTFEGPISCELLTDPAQSFDATATGTFGVPLD